LNIVKDPTNNASPRRILQNLTDLRINQDLRNYQTAHVFGRTKNPYSFTAGWNLAFIPKVIDPFTGHEAKGEYVNEYQKLFTDKAFELFEEFIDEFNQIVTSAELREKIETHLVELKRLNHLTDDMFARFEKDVWVNFEPIYRIDEGCIEKSAIEKEITDLNEGVGGSIRCRASFWLADQNQNLRSYKSSRFFNDQKYDWWFTVKKDKHLSDDQGCVNLMCEKEDQQGAFFLLTLPIDYIYKNFPERKNAQDIDIKIVVGSDGQIRNFYNRDSLSDFVISQSS